MTRKPRYQDFSLQECAEAAEKILAEAPPGSAFFQKWTCAGCGDRVTGATPNRFFTRGLHEDCGHVTDLSETGCNYSVHYAVGGLASLPHEGEA